MNQSQVFQISIKQTQLKKILQKGEEEEKKEAKDNFPIDLEATTKRTGN